MLEKIGFNEIKNYSLNIIHYERTYKVSDITEIEIIEFSLNNYTISLARKIIYNDMITYGSFNNIDNRLLEGITEKCKELNYF